MKPKQKKRLIQLAAIVVAGALLFLVGVYVLGGMRQRKLIAARDLGLAEFAQGKYEQACNDLAVYLRPNSNRTEPDVIYKFALSNLLVADSSPEHLKVAKNWFHVYLALKPDGLEAWKHLIDIYLQLGGYVEAIKAADEVLRVEPDNTTALRTTIYCESGLGHTEKALESAEKLARDLPNDIWNNHQKRILLWKLNRTEEALKFAQGIADKMPDDLENNHWVVATLQSLRRPQEALVFAQKIASIRPQDIENGVSVVELLGKQDKMAEILPFASKRYASQPDSAASEILMSVAYSEVDESLPQQQENAWTLDERKKAWKLAEKLDVDGAIRKRLDPNVTDNSFGPRHAAALFALKSASRLLDSSPTSQPASQPASNPVTRPAGNPAELRLTLIIARQLDRLRMYPVSVALLKKIDPAIDNPGVRDVLALRLWECNEFSEVNKRLAGFSPRPNAVAGEIELHAIHAVCLIKAARAERTDKESKIKAAKSAASKIADDLERMKALKAATKNELVQMRATKVAAAWEMILRVDYLGDEDKRSSLVDTVQRAIDSDREQPSPYLWAALGDAHTDLGERELAVSDFTHAANATPLWFLPHLRLSQRRREMGQMGEALQQAALAQQCLRNADTQTNYQDILASAMRTDSAVDLAIAQDEPRLLLCLRVLLERDQKDKAEKVLRGALAKESALSSITLIRLAEASRNAGFGLENECINAAIKKHGMTPELAFVQALLLSKPADIVASYERARATSTKPEDELAWRFHSARLLESIRDPGAGKAWTELGDDPALKGNLTIQWAVLTALSAQAESGLINRTVERLKAISGDGAKLWREALAEVLIKKNQRTQEETTKARELLDEAIRLAPESIDAHRLLADLLRGQDDIEGAAKELAVMMRLLPEPSLGNIITLADLYASLGRMDQARATLDQLRPLKLDAGQRELAEAEILERHGGPRAGDTQADAKAKLDAITAKFVIAAKAAPNDARVQVSYLSNLLHRDQIDDALAAARLVSSSLKSYEPIANFLKQERALTTLKSVPAAVALGDWILRGQRDSATAAEALNLLATSRSPSSSEAMSQLRLLADRAPLLIPLQHLLVNGYRGLGQYAEAASIASRIARAMPNSVELVRLAAQTQADAGDWNQALAAAEAWKKLVSGDPLDANLFCANMYLRQAESAEASKDVASAKLLYAAANKEMDIVQDLPSTTSKPMGVIAVKGMKSRILVASGDYDGANKLLGPLLAEKEWRAFYCDLAATRIKKAETVEEWLTALGKVTPANQADEQIVLAGGWIRAGIKHKREDFRDNGRKILKTLLDANPDKVAVVYGAAYWQALDGDRKASEAGYRKTLSLQANSAAAMNNLATILAEDKLKLDEAAALATKAVELQPREPSFADTLAFVEGKRKNQKAAMDAIQKSINLDPANAEWRLRKIELCLDFGDKAGAAKAIAEMDQLNKKLFSDDTVERLRIARSKISGIPATMPAVR